MMNMKDNFDWFSMMFWASSPGNAGEHRVTLNVPKILYFIEVK